MISLQYLSIPPLTYYTLAVIAGITWSIHFPSYFLMVHVIVAAMLIFFNFHNHYYSIKKVLILISFLLGAFIQQRHAHMYTFWQQFIQNNPLHITLTITDEDIKQHSFLRYVYTGTITEILCTETGKRFYPHYTILLYTYKKMPISLGNSIKLFQYSLDKKSSSSIHHFLKREGVIATFVKKSLNFGICSSRHYSPTYSLHTYRIQHTHHLRKKLSRLAYQLYSLIFLGKKPFITREFLYIKHSCKAWGILHHMARSGLHLIACIGIWEKILRYIPTYNFIKHILLLLFSLFYYFLSWPTISFARSLIVFILYKLAALSNNQILSIYNISLITLFMLFHNPYIISFLDFQLSFGITFLLAWINHVTILRNRKLIKKYC